MSVNVNNQAVFFQNFTASFVSGGVIEYTTAGLIPSNSIGNRVFALTMSGRLRRPLPGNVKGRYEILLDFSKVDSSYQIRLEQPIDGQLSIGRKMYNANSVMEYDAREVSTKRLLRLFINPRDATELQ